jgi:hypothetical protein
MPDARPPLTLRWYVTLRREKDGNWKVLSASLQGRLL